jgi:hypothetical protein
LARLRDADQVVSAIEQSHGLVRALRCQLEISRPLDGLRDVHIACGPDARGIRPTRQLTAMHHAETARGVAELVLERALDALELR